MFTHINVPYITFEFDLITLADEQYTSKYNEFLKQKINTSGIHA